MSSGASARSAEAPEHADGNAWRIKSAEYGRVAGLGIHLLHAHLCHMQPDIWSAPCHTKATMASTPRSHSPNQQRGQTSWFVDLLHYRELVRLWPSKLLIVPYKSSQNSDFV